MSLRTGTSSPTGTDAGRRPRMTRAGSIAQTVRRDGNRRMRSQGSHSGVAVDRDESSVIPGWPGNPRGYATDQPPGAPRRVPLDGPTRARGRGSRAPGALAGTSSLVPCRPGRGRFRARLSRRGAARRFIAGLLEGSPFRDDAVVVLSELFTNALLHTASGKPGGLVVVQVSRWRHGVRIAVTDQGSAASLSSATPPPCRASRERERLVPGGAPGRAPGLARRRLWAHGRRHPRPAPPSAPPLHPGTRPSQPARFPRPA